MAGAVALSAAALRASSALGESLLARVEERSGFRRPLGGVMVLVARARILVTGEEVDGSVESDGVASVQTFLAGGEEEDELACSETLRFEGWTLGFSADFNSFKLVKPLEEAMGLVVGKVFKESFKLAEALIDSFSSSLIFLGADSLPLCSSTSSIFLFLGGRPRRFGLGLDEP